MIVGDPPFYTHSSKDRCDAASAVALHHDVQRFLILYRVIVKPLQFIKPGSQRGFPQLQNIFLQMILGILADIDSVWPSEIKSCLCCVPVVCTFLFPEMSQFLSFYLLISPLPVYILNLPVHLGTVCVDLLNAFLRFYLWKPGKRPEPVIPADLDILFPEFVGIFPGCHILMFHARIPKARSGDVKLNDILSVQSVFRACGMVKRYILFRFFPCLFYLQIIKGFITLPSEFIDDRAAYVITEIVMPFITELPCLFIVILSTKSVYGIPVLIYPLFLLPCNIFGRLFILLQYFRVIAHFTDLLLFSVKKASSDLYRILVGEQILCKIHAPFRSQRQMNICILRIIFKIIGRKILHQF